MRVELLGVKEVDFTPEGGERICGTKIFVCTPAEDKDSYGKMPNSLWIDKDKKDDILAIDLHSFVGSTIDVEYNNKGKAIMISA